MSVIEYPKLDCKLDKRRKLCGGDKSEIMKLREQGLTWVKIANMFNVHLTTIYRIAYPETYLLEKERVRIRNNERYHTDPKFRKRIIESSKRIVKQRMANDPNYRAWAKAKARDSNYHNYWINKK